MSEAAPTKEKFSVLLVDDDPTVIRVLSCILNGYFPLRFAMSGAVALKLARESLPDLVLLDMDMPDFNGFETCKAFKNDPLLVNVPIVFMSSHDSFELEAAGMQLGAVDFVGKPPHASLVLARVRTYQQLKSLSDTVRSAVTMDFLTGAASRRQMEKALAQEWLHAQRRQSALALVLVDLVGFARFNREFGEVAGDACLRAVADSLRAVLPLPSDVLARHGGGSFALLMTQTDHASVERLGAAVRRTVAQLQLGIEIAVGGAVRVPSAGVDEPCAGSMPCDLLEDAERALRAAKVAVGRRVVIAEPAKLNAGRSAARGMLA